MALVVFDLDETLISTDSDHIWGEYVADHNLVDESSFREENQRFYDNYKRGELDIDAYMRFSCRVLAEHEPALLIEHRKQFIEQRIQPNLLPKALELVDSHRQKGDTLIVVTATIKFITEPIVELLGIENLIAPVPEQIDGRYTGEVVGIPSFAAGKVTRLNDWVKQRNQSLEGSYCYTDSISDLPLLKLVENPVAVDPDPGLLKIAQSQRWPVISLRG